MKPFHLALKRLKSSFRYRLFLLHLSWILRKSGISISPYYLNQEGTDDSIKIKVDPGVEPVVFEFLTPEEIEGIFKHPESKTTTELKETIQTDKTLCAALKHNHEIMAFVFVNLTCCRSIIATFPLQENEAYLFNQFTYNKYRGKNLAPYLRQEMYHHLISMGHPRLYSITEYLNTSAIAFKNKLKAKPIKLGLYIKLFNLFEKNFTLKTYDSLEPESELIDCARNP